jgi:hypothetical protein
VRRLETLAAILFCLFWGLGRPAAASIAQRNWAAGKPTTQSSVALGGVSARAVDGNTNGDWNAGSVTHTNEEKQPYWDVDLGASFPVDIVKLHNRTDCCRERLHNVWVFVSENPFTHRDPGDTLQEPGILFGVVWGDAGDPLPAGARAPFHTVTIVGSDTPSGRYVRVQLAGTGSLSLAEVEVLQQVEIAGPAGYNDSLQWRAALPQTSATGLALVGEGNVLMVYLRGPDGLLHASASLGASAPVSGSPALSDSAPAAIWSREANKTFLAVRAADGSVQIAEGGRRRNPLLPPGVSWTWQGLGRGQGSPAVVAACGKVVVAWLDDGSIRSAWKATSGMNPTWSPVQRISDGVSPPSLAATWLGTIGIGYLRAGGGIAFGSEPCASDLTWTQPKTLVGTSWGDGVGLATYGDLFAMTTLGGNKRPYFEIQTYGANGLPMWPGFEPIFAGPEEEPLLQEAPRLVSYRGIFLAAARDTSGSIYYWLRNPNALTAPDPRRWLAGRPVGGSGTSAAPPAMAIVGLTTFDELVDSPAELYLAARGVQDQRLYVINFGRFAARAGLEKSFHVELTPNPNSGMEPDIIPNLFEHLVAMLSVPSVAWDGLGSKPCPVVQLATQVHLHRLVAGQARPGNCPMEIYLNAGTQSARFMMHEWLHIDFFRRKIGKVRDFDQAFGDPHPKKCESSRNCGGDVCEEAGGDVTWFDDPAIVRWAKDKVCKADGRPQGGVFWYELQSDEHAFIETAVRYGWHGDELRYWAAWDAGRGNSQLQTRYNWLKANFFGGQEYNGWSSSGISTNPAIPAGDRSMGSFGMPRR